jgi:outer membrane protein TolC
MVLSALIEMAPAQNPNVRIAGVRVLQARAQLGAAIGELHPQHQATGEVRYEKLSDRDSSSALLQEVQQDVGNAAICHRSRTTASGSPSSASARPGSSICGASSAARCNRPMPT